MKIGAMKSHAFEYGVAALGIHTILVLGHTKCGAVAATVEDKPLPDNMSAFVDAIRPAIAGLPAPMMGANGKPDITPAVEANTRYQMQQLLARSEILRQAQKDGKLLLLCAIYDVENGKVRFLD